MAQTRVPVDGFNTALQAVLARMPNTTSSQLANLRAAQRVIAERCDEIERLPEAFNSFWITSPCNIIHLVSPADDSPPDDMTKEN